MSRSIRLGAGLAFATLLAACATSTPVHYYTLTPPDGGDDIASTAPFLLDLLSVTVPVEVDRQELVVRQGTGTLDLLDGERWAAPLGDEIHAALATSLARKLGAQNVGALPKSADKPVLRVKLAVRRFDAAPGQYAALEADWSLVWADATDKRRLLCGSRLRTPVSAGYAGVVQGYQQLLHTLSGQIAAAAASWANGQAGQCPPGKP
ncbi:PqiC family protein [Chitinimonas naiadis]